MTNGHSVVMYFLTIPKTTSDWSGIIFVIIDILQRGSKIYAAKSITFLAFNFVYLRCFALLALNASRMIRSISVYLY